ncbi:MAG: hypothetical protein AAF449_14160, partial [Myxococcota bacterium]
PWAAPCPSPSDWLTWLILSDDGHDRFGAASEGWIAMYRRDYSQAVASFGKTPTGVDREGARRSHAALGRLYERLSRLHAQALLGYLTARREGGLPSIPKADEVAVVAAAVADVPPPKWAGDPLLTGVDCSQSPVSSSEVLEQHLSCSTPPPCSPKTAPSKAGTLWADRFDAYAAVLCEPASPDDLRRWALEPIVRTNLRAPDEIVEGVEVMLFDPLAMWVMARRQQNLAARHKSTLPPSDWMAHVLSSSPDGQQPLSIIDLDASRAAAVDARSTVAEARRCAKGGPGSALVAELDLSEAIADGILRRTAGIALRDGRCDDALALLRATVDTASVDRITFKNEPGFLVQLATAAVCMQRLPEAIGALRAVHAMYKEAQGTLTAVEQLAVARLMGGVGGVQKRQ